MRLIRKRGNQINLIYNQSMNTLTLFGSHACELIALIASLMKRT